jgi:hypothetical protein
MRRAKSIIGAAAGLLVLAGGLAIIDERVRFSFMRMLEGGAPTGDVAHAASSLEDMSYLVLSAIRDQSIEHAPLTLFAIGAMVLVLFMTRT